MLDSSELLTASLNTPVPESTTEDKAQTEDEELTVVDSEDNEEEQMDVDGSDSLGFMFMHGNKKVQVICS